MYSYNSTKHNYLQVGDSLEVYSVSTKLPLDYKGPDVQSDSEKDFDHLKQLIGIYGKILFFTAPTRAKDKYEFSLTLPTSDKSYLSSLKNIFWNK